MDRKLESVCHSKHEEVIVKHTVESQIPGAFLVPVSADSSILSKQSRVNKANLTALYRVLNQPGTALVLVLSQETLISLPSILTTALPSLNKFDLVAMEYAYDFSSGDELGFLEHVLWRLS